MKLYWRLHRKYNSILDWFACKFQNPYEINAGGNCPVEAEGYLPTGEFYYFRARGSNWRLEIAKGEDAGWVERIKFSYGEKYCDDQFGAGWMTRREAIKFANKAIKFYYQKREL